MASVHTSVTVQAFNGLEHNKIASKVGKYPEAGVCNICWHFTSFRVEYLVYYIGYYPW